MSLVPPHCIVRPSHELPGWEGNMTRYCTSVGFLTKLKLRENATQEWNTSPYCLPIWAMLDFMIYFATSELFVQLTAEHGKWQEQKTFTGKNGKLMTSQLFSLRYLHTLLLLSKPEVTNQHHPFICTLTTCIMGRKSLPTLHTGKYSYRITKCIIKYYCHMTFLYGLPVLITLKES